MERQSELHHLSRERRVATLSHRLYLTDALFLIFLTAMSVGLVLRPGRVANWLAWLIINVIVFAAIGLVSSWAERGPAWRFLHDWYPLAMFIVLFEETAQLSFLIRSGWRDHYLLAFENHIFSIPPTLWLARFNLPILSEVFNVGYFSYFLLLMIVGGLLYARHNTCGFRQVMDASVIAYVICYAFFLSFPTEGPAYTLAAVATPCELGPFYWLVMFIQKYAGVHGNAFPNSHVAAAVVALVFAWRHMPRLGLVLSPLVILLCMGAVYDGYHYMSDVVAGAVVGVVACGIGASFCGESVRIRKVPLSGPEEPKPRGET